MSKLEEAMEKQLKAVGVEFERELMLVPNRRFRFDFTFRSAGLVAEIEGGTWSGGRHTTGAGFRQDCVKYNLASLEGWTVMRFTSDMVKKGLALEQIVAYLDQEEAQASSDGL